MHIVHVGTAYPPHYADQEALIGMFEAQWAKRHHNVARVGRFHRAVQVQGRHLALPPEAYGELRGFGQANDAFLEVGVQIGEQALREALHGAGLEVQDVDAVFSSTVTGVVTPSLEARLFHRMGLREDLKRTPLFGLGCSAGAAGLARVHDYLLAFPDDVAVLLCVELCSLTLQRNDLSVSNLVASGLFGDGAAAVVCVGARRAERMGRTLGPVSLATGRRMYPDSERIMGWDVVDEGFKLVLAKSVPAMVERYLRDDVDAFLAKQDLTLADIGCWCVHPGGPRVLKVCETVLELEEDALAASWASMQEAGNMSSVSVLYILRDTMQQLRPTPGTLGLILAVGPGFCVEMVLVRW